MNSNQIETLPEYILRVTAEEGVSLNEVSRRAERRGYKITQPHISKIISGATQNPSVEKLQALAAGLNRPEDEIFAVARGQHLDDAELNDALANAMLFEYQQLESKDKDALAPMVKALKREIEERLEKQPKK